MTYVALAGAGPDFERTFAEATGGAYLSMPGPVAADPDVLLAHVNGAGDPEVLVLDSRADADSALALADRFTAERPGTVVLLASDRSDEVGLRAMRAGVRDIIPTTADATEIRQALQAAVSTANRLSTSVANSQPGEGPGGAKGRVITVISPKGGAGKTTVATNLAVALARTMPHSTVLVDLDLQFGDVATALNLTPDYTLPDALPSAASADTIALKTYLSLHLETGLYVLAAPEHPAAADTISSAQISQLLQLLATEFTYVVVDTSPGLSDHTLAALDQTTDPLLLTALSVPGARGMRKVIDTLSQLQMFSGGHRVVVNFADAGHGMSADDVEATLGVAVGTSLPTSKAAPASLNRGIPLMQSRIRDPLVKALTPLVDSLLPDGITLEGRGKHRGARRGAR
ncbi:AAA family ATPase [Pseudactinotalea sp. Z1748]|uniref:AAA family ATPase n=1 Tax=Pseudactinotalea sp. Z1748 TaxID=3413027 RepID=UPI003C7DFD6B